jgi:hypothetical protein
MKQIQSSCLGCAGVLIVLGILGLLSAVVNLGSSNRAIIQMFFLMANSFGSVTKFSIITIGAGVLIILAVFLINELQQSKAEAKEKR